MNQTIIKIYDKAGDFAENKDIARDIRLNEIIPALEKQEKVVLNFEKVSTTTQSFIHALISDIFRIYGFDVLDRIIFKSCTETVKEIINIVIDYMQEAR